LEVVAGTTALTDALRDFVALNRSDQLGFGWIHLLSESEAFLAAGVCDERRAVKAALGKGELAGEISFPRRRLLTRLLAAMNDRPADLLSLISQARKLVPDERHIWCTASDTFDSRVVQRRGVLLGGAISPLFLRDTGEMWSSGTPWTVRLRHSRVVLCDNNAAREPVASWIPLMEATVAAGESLLVVTEMIDSELLHTLVVNALKATLPVCVVHPPKARGGLAPGMEWIGRAHSSPPREQTRLPRIGEAWVRRTATALFPSVTETAVPESVQKNFAVIETGGEHHEDQQARLRFLMRELQLTDHR
jgi:hypothetical protein